MQVLNTKYGKITLRNCNIHVSTATATATAMLLDHKTNYVQIDYFQQNYATRKTRHQLHIFLNTPYTVYIHIIYYTKHQIVLVGLRVQTNYRRFNAKSTTIILALGLYCTLTVVKPSVLVSFWRIEDRETKNKNHI